MSRKEINDHLKHVTYPTDKKKLVEACNNMADVPKQDKEWFVRNLPDRLYRSPDDIINALIYHKSEGALTEYFAGILNISTMN